MLSVTIWCVLGVISCLSILSCALAPPILLTLIIRATKQTQIIILKRKMYHHCRYYTEENVLLRYFMESVRPIVASFDEIYVSRI